MNYNPDATRVITPRTLKRLPVTFDVKAVKRTTKEYCLLCEAVFTKMIGKNPVRHCKKCGKSICAVCSETRRQLSQRDTNAHRVCDKCDTEMDNFVLKENHERVLTMQISKIDFLQRQVENMDDWKQNNQDNIEKS